MKITKKDKDGNLVTYEGIIEIFYAYFGCSGCLFVVLGLLYLLLNFFGFYG
jgi:hypothetical protein